MLEFLRRTVVVVGLRRRNEKIERGVVEQHGERDEADLSARQPIGGTQDSDRFARVAVSAVHEREIVVQCRLPERVEIGSMAGKQ